MIVLFQNSALRFWRGRIGLFFILLGELFVVSHLRPFSDYYFPVVWLGYILFADATCEAQVGWSLATRYTRSFLTLFPTSAVIWWLFEWLNQAVHNWVYLGGGRYGSGPGFVSIATLDFSTVLPAVWCTSLCVLSLLPRHEESRSRRRVPARALCVEFALGMAALIAPIAFPSYAFGLIWVCVGLLLDPINCALQRPSVIDFAWNVHWRTPCAFALGALICGIFWESWNFWAMPKWIYIIPHVGWFHVFEMPILGYSGYLPFGLELFVLTYFVFPFIGVRPPTIETLRAEGFNASGYRAAS